MRKSHEYFLALAKTLHFTQAASQLYISQQALSDQIKRLEEELDVQLFIRKPKLKLSPEGELLQSKLYEMQRMEQELYYEMKDLKQTSRGSINIGMHDARAKVLLPLVLKKFHSEYPHVVVKIVSDHTQNYGKRLAEGEVDFFFGINAEVGNELQEEILANEPMVLIVPNQLLRTMFSDHLEEKLTEFSKGADLRYFSEVPFIFGLPISQGQQSINKYLNRIGIHLQVPLFLNVYASQFLLLNIYNGACFCPQMLVSLIKQYNLAQPKESQLQAFPLLDFQEWLVLSLIRYKDAYLPYYAERFYQITKETVLSLVNNPLTTLL